LGQNCKFRAQTVGALGSLGISKQRAAKMFNRFDIGTSVCRLLACAAPIKSGLFGPLGSVAMLREQFRLSFSNLGELVFQCLDDAGVKRASWFS
jgi:hypothetical protein